MDRVYFQIPFTDKDRAKALGARWDTSHRLWFAEDSQIVKTLATYWKTLTSIEPISELPCEDRQFGGDNLYLDLIPASCWFVNVRYCIEQEDWQRLGTGVRERAGHKCEICQAEEDKDAGIFLEAHKRWEFIEATGEQILRRIICLCSLCHRTNHYGYAQVVGQEPLVRKHFMSVNGCTLGELNDHVQEAFELWRLRNGLGWTLDLSIITDAGIRLKSKPRAKPRERQHGGLTIDTVDVEDFINRML